MLLNYKEYSHILYIIFNKYLNIVFMVTVHYTYWRKSKSPTHFKTILNEVNCKNILF